ncbi:MAG: DUF4332 domain-containing protein [Thermodesulfobacteriota bacterium]
MKKRLPLHGMIGIALLGLSEFLLFRKVDPFYSWFYCFAWWSYILIIDGVVYSLKGNSLLINRRREFFLLIPFSVFIWLIFEAANLCLENWYYINLPSSIAERWLGYFIAFGTVLPGIFETTKLLETLGLFKNATTRKINFRPWIKPFFILLGLFCLISPLVFPKYFFSLIWIAFIFLLEPFLYHFGGQSLLKDLEGGKPRKIYLLLIAGLICGLLWEFWNYWSRAKWLYTVPFFEELKVFEMPLAGFLGFPPFAIEVYVMVNFLSLFKPRRLAKIFISILLIAFYLLVFNAIDSKTVDSFYPRLNEAYWIDKKYRDELPKAGILNLEDLIIKTKSKAEREELALRLSISKEELEHWIKKARLVQLKGIGIRNLKQLEEVGIESVSSLAQEDPETLYQRLKERSPFLPISKKAKIKIWIKEAKKGRKEG